MLKDKLEIFIVTYNRDAKLKNTFDQILDKDSPVKHLDITVLDNNSTDNTVSIIKKYQKKFKNLKHLRHKRNIGANANIARAYEEATKEYIWILADDDNYDFTSFSEVEKAISNNEDIIMVAKYAIPSNWNLLDLIIQATFTPSVILSTRILNDTALRNIYDNIYTMYVQLVPIVMYINKSKSIYLLDGPAIVLNGEDYGKNNPLFHHPNYHRGANIADLYYRSATISQPVGISNALENLQHQVKYVFMKYHINTALYYFKPFSKDFMYFADIWVSCSNKQKYLFMWKLLKKILSNIVSFTRNDSGIYIKIFNILKIKIIPLKNNK